MSVPVRNRTQSKTEYVEELRRLNVDIGQLTVNGPKKYARAYGDRLASTALDAYGHACAANSIYLSADPVSYEKRRGHLIEARALVHSLAAQANVYIDLTVRTDGVSKEKAYRRAERIGDRCNSAIKLIGGVLRSDKERFDGYNKA